MFLPPVSSSLTDCVIESDAIVTVSPPVWIVTIIFILSYRLNWSIIPRLMYFVCALFQGKAAPPTGQRPAEMIDAIKDTRQVFLGLQEIFK